MTYIASSPLFLADVSDWRPDLNTAIFISVFFVLVLAFNLLPVRVYGESEFVFGLMKTLLVVGLIVACLFVDWGANPAHDYIGGRYWRRWVLARAVLPARFS